MARIISQVDPATGRRVKVGAVEGDTFAERNANIATAFGVSPKKANRITNEQLSTAALSSAPDFNLKLPPTSSTGSSMSLDATLSALPKTLAEQKAQTQQAEQNSFDALLTAIDSQQTPSQIRLAQEQKLGIPQLDTYATDLSNQLLAEQEQLRKETERIQSSAGTATASERDRQVSELQRVSRRTQADIAITQLAAQGRLDAARRVADLAVQAETEHQQQQLSRFEMVYERNKDLFTKAEQRDFETAQEERKRQFEIQSYEYKARLDQKIRESDPLYQEQLKKAREATVYSPNGTINGKPQNATQAQINGYADRLTEANTILGNIGNQFASNFAFGGILPSYLQNSNRQLFEQAKRNFVNSVLRRESGAVISPSEFANADKQYFPQPGDSQAVLAQKAANRETVINNLYREANVARPVSIGDVVEYGGKQYEVMDEQGNLQEI